MKKLDILYNTDNKFIDYVLASMISLIENGKVEELTFHIVTLNFSISDYNRFEELYNYYSNINIKYYDLEDINIESYGINGWHGSQIANGRLFFQDILGDNINNIDKLLYLDGDTIVIDDLSELERCKLGCVKDLGILQHRKDNLNIKGDYYNSGVIFIDIEEWLQHDYQEKIRNFICNNDTSSLSFPDQDVINLVLGDYITTLPLGYNLPAYHYLFNEKEKKKYFSKNRAVKYDELDLQINPKILHAYGLFGIQPWSLNKVNPYNDLFMKYIIKGTPEYQQQKLNKMRKIFDNELLIKSVLIGKGYLSPIVEDKAKTLWLKYRDK